MFQRSFIRFNRHCLLFYSVYIVHGSTLLFALILTAYYFTAVYIVHVSTLLFALIFSAYYFILYILLMLQLSYSR